MESGKLVSIVVPIYNVAEYLPTCLNSVYSQLRDDYEIILVDDGSTDNSGNICDSYKAQYPSTIVIHKENGGLSDARNVGIEVASGKYVFFVDSDDWLAPQAIEELLECAERNQCEVVQSGFYYSYEEYQMCSFSHEQGNRLVLLSREEAMCELIKNVDIKNFAWGKLYLTSIVKKYKFPKGFYYEDIYWKHYIIHNVNRYALLYKPLYYYRQRTDSISGDFSIRAIDLLKGAELRLRFVKNNYPQFYDLMLGKYWLLTTTFYRRSKTYADNLVRKTFKEYWIYANETYERPFKYRMLYSSMLQLFVRAMDFLKRLCKKGI